MRKNIYRSCAVLFLSLLLCMVGTVSASAETAYIVTEQELTQLETNLAELKSQRAFLLNELKALSNEQIALENQLAELKALSSQQETQLAIANKSLEAFAKEEKSRLRKIKRQRSLAYALTGGLAYYIFKDIFKEASR